MKDFIEDRDLADAIADACIRGWPDVFVRPDAGQPPRPTCREPNCTAIVYARGQCERAGR